MGCWVKSGTSREIVLRDGKKDDDPVINVGFEPVYLMNKEPEELRGDRELVVLADRKAPTKKELDEQDKAQEAWREARAERKALNRQVLNGYRPADSLTAASVDPKPEIGAPGAGAGGAGEGDGGEDGGEDGEKIPPALD